MTLIPNGANTEQFTYDTLGAQHLIEKLGLTGKFVAMYAGIHGLAQGLETLLEAAKLVLTDESPVEKDLVTIERKGVVSRDGLTTLRAVGDSQCLNL